MIRRLLLGLLLLPALAMAVEAPVTPTPAAANASGEAKVLYKGRLVTQEFKDNSEQGLVLFKGKWVSEAEMYQSKGYVKHLGTWISPQRLDEIRQHQVQMPVIELSSTDLRQRVASGHSLRYRLPRAVEKYLQTHSLYQSSTSAEVNP